MELNSLEGERIKNLAANETSSMIERKVFFFAFSVIKQTCCQYAKAQAGNTNHQIEIKKCFSYVCQANTQLVNFSYPLSKVVIFFGLVHIEIVQLVWHVST